MKKKLIEKYSSDEAEYSIYKIFLDKGIKYQAYIDDEPVGMKIEASYPNLSDYHNSILPNFEDEACKVIKHHIYNSMDNKT